LKVISEQKETYGYEIQRYVEEKSEGRITLKDATVYPILRYLVKKKVLESYWTEPGKGMPRKYYSLTPQGKILLSELIADYRALIEEVNKILDGGVDD